MLGIYRLWFNIEDKLEKLKSLISIAAIDIKLRYCRYSTTWSSRYSHTASIILTAFSPSSWPWALPQSYGLPGKQEEIYVSSNIFSTVSQTFSNYVYVLSLSWHWWLKKTIFRIFFTLMIKNNCRKKWYFGLCSKLV